MKITINEDQLKMLAEKVSLTDKQFNETNNLIQEGGMREYLVSVVVAGYFAKIRIHSQNSATAIQIVSKLYKGARFTGVVKVV